MNMHLSVFWKHYIQFTLKYIISITLFKSMLKCISLTLKFCVNKLEDCWIGFDSRCVCWRSFSLWLMMLHIVKWRVTDHRKRLYIILLGTVSFNMLCWLLLLLFVCFLESIFKSKINSDRMVYYSVLLALLHFSVG